MTHVGTAAGPGRGGVGSVISAQVLRGLPAVMGLVGFAIALAGSWRPSLWDDETASISAAERSPAALWRMIHHIDAVHGAYYLFLHYWIGVFGQSAFSVRFPSAVAIGLMVAGVVVLVRQLCVAALGVRAAGFEVLAGALVALNPRVTWAGIEARSSAIAAAITLWATVAFLAALRRRRAGWWVLYAVLMALGALVFEYVALVGVAHLISLAWAWVRTRRPRASVVATFLPPVVALLVAAALAAPLVHLSMTERFQIPHYSTAWSNLLRNAGFQQWFAGMLPTASQLLDLHHWSPLHWTGAIIWLAVLTWVVLLSAGVVGAVRGARPAREQPERDESTAPVIPSVVELAVPWLVVPVAAVIAYSQIVHPIYNPRYFTFCIPALELLLAYILWQVWRRFSGYGRVLPAVFLAVVLALTAPIYVSQRGPTAKKAADWAQAATWLADHSQPGDIVVYTERARHAGGSMAKIAIAYPKQTSDLVNITANAPGSVTNTLWGSWTRLYKLPASRLAPLEQHRTVFVVTDKGAPYTRPGDPERAVLDRYGYRIVATWRGTATRIYELKN